MHHEFKPVFDWIFYGPGRVVYGGTKYKDELKKARRYFGIFLELRKQRKAIEVDDFKVDQRQAELEEMVKHKDFDDAHIIAIVIVSGCRLICSNDSRAYTFIQDKKLYPKNFKRAKIYKGLSNQNLLLAGILPSICRLCKDG